MTCCNSYENKVISIYKGFGTKWNNEDLLTVTFDSSIDLTGFGAELYIGNTIKTYENIGGGFVINLTAQETGALPVGPNTGTLVIVDRENHKKPFSTELPFLVKDWEGGDIKLDGFKLNINAKIQENDLVVRIETSDSGIIIERYVREQISIHNEDENAHPYIRGLVSEKQDIITDLDEIRSGAENGSTSIQPNDNISLLTNNVGFITSTALNGYATEQWVQNQGYTTNLGTVTSVNNIEPVNGNVTINIPSEVTETTVTNWGFTKNKGTVTSVNNITPVNGNVSLSIPTVNNATLKIQKNGSDVATFTANSSTNTTANITVPTQPSDIGAATSAQGTLADSSLQPSDIINNTSSTNTNKPLSANMGKSLQDQINNLNGRGRYLALWNCETGLAQSNPQQSPYTYKTGDYFIVGTIATGSGTNYRPGGSSYTTGVPSIVVETEDVAVNDVYYYDGTNWSLQINTQKEVSFGSIAGDPYDNTNLASALNVKQDELVEGTGIDIDSTTNTISNSGVRSVTTGSSNGTISVNTGGTTQDVSVYGLGSAAYTPTTDYATYSQGAKADTALQPSALNGYATETWVGNQGYLTQVTSSDVTTALGYTPYSSSNPAGYTSNIGTVTSVNNVSPVNGNVTISIPSEVTETTVTNWGFTKNVGTVTSVNNVSPVNGNVSLSIPSVEAYTAAEIDTIWNSVTTT